MTIKRITEIALWIGIIVFALVYTYLKYFNVPKLNDYPEEEKVSMIRSCMKEGESLDYCVCGLTALRQEYTFDGLRQNFAESSLEFRTNFSKIQYKCKAATSK